MHQHLQELVSMHLHIQEMGLMLQHLKSCPKERFLNLRFHDLSSWMGVGPEFKGHP